MEGYFKTGDSEFYHDRGIVIKMTVKRYENWQYRMKMQKVTSTRNVLISKRIFFNMTFIANDKMALILISFNLKRCLKMRLTLVPSAFLCEMSILLTQTDINSYSTY